METMQFHITQIVYFLRPIVVLHASGLNDKFGIRNYYRGEGIRLIINIFLVSGHCLLFIFQ